MICLGESYLGIMYDYPHKLLYQYHVIQADETPVLVNKDGCSTGSKSWMWVYRSGFMYADKQIIRYEYQKTRNASHPRELLRNYSGICVTDGYQVYHTLAKEKEDLRITGCWVHCRRKFREALEIIPKDLRKQSVLYLIMNQECYLRVFLEDGDVPMDNNAIERTIRGFCIGKKNWEMIDTINSASSSAIIYSIAETAKTNQLKPYDYFECLLKELPKHMDDDNNDFLAELLPWSEKPCRNTSENQ